MLKRIPKLNAAAPIGATGPRVAKAQRKAAPVVAKQADAEKVAAPVETPAGIKTMQPESIEDILLTKAQEQDAKQELIAPHEWAALLNAPENESEETTLGIPGIVDGEIEAAHELDAADELWERLSSTRWIKEPPQDIYNHVTVANRPSKA